MSQSFFTRVAELSTRGEAFVLATVVRVETPTSARPGDKAIITADGRLHGWVGGSCVQPLVRAEAQRALADGQARLIRFSTTPDIQSPRAGLIDLAMTCFSGGTVEMYLEPQIPAPRLLIVGGAPIAQALVQLGQLMRYHVMVADLDQAIEPDGDQRPAGDELVDDLSRLPQLVTPTTYTVVATHGAYDELALSYILPARPAYVALVASKTRAQAVLEYLASAGMAPELLAELKYPAGLDIQAGDPQEIAISIMAEIIQRRHVFAVSKPSASVVIPSPVATLGQIEAIDPVCGMSVVVAQAHYSYDYGGLTHYFCCPGCRKSFMGEPEHYLDRGAVRPAA